MLAVTPFATVTWPVAGDAPGLQAIIAEQASAIADQEALLHAYQGNLNALQQPAPGPSVTAQATTAGASTTVTLAQPSGVVANGSTVTGTGVPAAPPATTVLGQISGTLGGAGTYLFSQALNLATATTLTLSPPPPAPAWPTPADAPTLNTIVQNQTAIIRVQTALLQHYQDLLNNSATPAPPTGP